MLVGQSLVEGSTDGIYRIVTDDVKGIVDVGGGEFLFHIVFLFPLFILQRLCHSYTSEKKSS